MATGPALAAALPAEPLCDWLAGVGIAAQAQADGDFASAERAARRALAARPRGVAAARAQAALGLALLARQDAAEAADALEAALGSPLAPARAHLAHARGEALLAAGDAPRAARLFSEAAAAASAHSLSGPARLREAQALLGAGLAAEAVPVLEQLLAGPSATREPEVRLTLARVFRAIGEDERAVAAYRALWLEQPETSEAAVAGGALEAWRRAGGPVPPDSGVERALRAERLLATGRPEAALLELAAARRADEPADPERLELLRATALLALSRHEEAERVALPLAGANAEDVQRGARFVLARSAARAGRVDEAIRFYEDVAGSRAPIPGLPEWRQRDVGDESAFLASWLLYDAGAYHQAIPALERFARRYPRSRRAEDALWFAAWSRYRLGRLAEAERAFARLSRGPLADGAQYWRARIARGKARQRALYRSSIALADGGWYALLSRARLASLGGAPPPAATLPRARPLPDAQGVWAAGTLSVAVELLGLGLREEALAELRDLARNGRVRSVAPLVAQLAAFAGDAELPFRMARDHLRPTRRSVRWGHPEPAGETLRRACRALGLDPALVLGVLRRESRFDEDARSGAGARGLMQLRPSTAERLATLLGVPSGVRERLTDPEVNVTLGAHYLSLLVARFEEPLMAIAAYNAGPSVVAEWARARRGLALDAWVESIPYRETRRYVKTVLVEWSTYRALAGDPPPPIDPVRAIRAPGPGVEF